MAARLAGGRAPAEGSGGVRRGPPGGAAVGAPAAARVARARGRWLRRGPRAPSLASAGAPPPGGRGGTAAAAGEQRALRKGSNV